MLKPFNRKALKFFLGIIFIYPIYLYGALSGCKNIQPDNKKPIKDTLVAAKEDSLLIKWHSREHYSTHQLRPIITNIFLKYKIDTTSSIKSVRKLFGTPDTAVKYLSDNKKDTVTCLTYIIEGKGNPEADKCWLDINFVNSKYNNSNIPCE